MKDIRIEEFDVLTIRKMTEDNVRNIKALPIKEDSSFVYVLTAGEENGNIEEIKFKFGKEVELIKIDEGKLDFFIQMVYLGQKQDSEEIIMKNAIAEKASDIHFEPYKDKVMVRYRIDGLLKVKYIMTKTEYQSLVSKIKINAGLDITERRKPQDGKISLKHNKYTYDIRVSITPVIFGEKIVLRVFYGNISKYSLDNLKLVKEQLVVLEKIIKRKTGMVIVNGPTGSGKSTTLYTILQHENTPDINIITLEDPVEVIIPGINQVMVNTKESINFAEGIKSALRQDPDVIMLGEIRDEDTAEMAIRAALTGHKVYTTIHCKEPREVYFRLEEMGVKKYLIKDALIGIISQRLIRLLCDSCKVEDEIDGKGRVYYKRGKGCEKCSFTGYLGRSLVAAVYYLDKRTREQLGNIYDNERILSNELMKDNLDYLLAQGSISQGDYQDFIEREEIIAREDEDSFQ